MITCFHCGYKIISQEHKNLCTTINIMQYFENSNINELKQKPMMANKINGSSVIIIVIYKDEEPIKIIFGHDSYGFKIQNKMLTRMLNKILTIYKDNVLYQIKILIKCPGEYHRKENGEYELFPKVTNEQNMLKYFENITIKYEPYNLYKYNNTNNALYLKLINDKLMYTNNYGKYITL